MEIYVVNYVYNLYLNCERAEPATELSWKKKPKIKGQIPIFNGSHVEPNFLEGVLSGVSYDDKIGLPLNRMRNNPFIFLHPSLLSFENAKGCNLRPSTWAQVTEKTNLGISTPMLHWGAFGVDLFKNPSLATITFALLLAALWHGIIN
jgi:hypothetical protein